MTSTAVDASGGPLPEGRTRGRSAIIEVAADLLHRGGTAAVTTRAVAAAAGVQAPTIYRLFGDKEGLLDAVAEHVFGAYVAAKGMADEAEAGNDGDPVADLDRGWDTHVGFGLSHPALFALMTDPERSTRLVTAAGGEDILAARVHRIAAAGRLRVPEPRAVGMIRAAGTGVVLTLLSMPVSARDPGLAAALYRAVKQLVIDDDPAAAPADASVAAVALRANLPAVSVLSPAERLLLTDWLDRVADPEPAAARRQA